MQIMTFWFRITIFWTVTWIQNSSIPILCMLNKNWWFLHFSNEFLDFFSFCLTDKLYLVNKTIFKSLSYAQVTIWILASLEINHSWMFEFHWDMWDAQCVSERTCCNSSPNRHNDVSDKKNKSWYVIMSICRRIACVETYIETEDLDF